MTPLPLPQPLTTIQALQTGIHGPTSWPIVSPLGLLLLSRPVASVMLCDEEATVLEFFGRYWVLEVGGARTGFFDTEDDAVRYLQDQMSATEEGGEENGY